MEFNLKWPQTVDGIRWLCEAGWGGEMDSSEDWELERNVCLKFTSSKLALR